MISFWKRLTVMFFYVFHINKIFYILHFKEVRLNIRLLLTDYLFWQKKILLIFYEICILWISVANILINLKWISLMILMILMTKYKNNKLAMIL